MMRWNSPFLSMTAASLVGTCKWAKDKFQHNTVPPPPKAQISQRTLKKVFFFVVIAAAEEALFVFWAWSFFVKLLIIKLF